MSRTFDFNAIQQETLETKLSGGVVLHVTTPPEKLIEQLAASKEEIGKLWTGEGNNVEKSRAAYDLVAKLISCNLEGVTVTADDLRDKHKISPVALAAYATSYMEYINDFHNAKN